MSDNTLQVHNKYRFIINGWEGPVVAVILDIEYVEGRMLLVLQPEKGESIIVRISEVTAWQKIPTAA